ncbi:MAG TPA: RDD family protein [Acidimicrobiales bacterium]|jgi:hypothetical protein|nr:RDD family protein [Acidimicrobiales bacterium]
MTRTGIVLHRHRHARPPVSFAGLPAAGFGARIKALLLTLGLIVVTLGVGWLLWSVVEWRRGSTASFRLTGLRVVRRGDGMPIGVGRSFLRNAVLCTVLLIPTILACIMIAVAFVMGASPPNDLFSKPRNAPWDRLTGTMVVQERRRPFSRGKYARLSEWPPANEPVSLN